MKSKLPFALAAVLLAGSFGVSESTILPAAAKKPVIKAKIERDVVMADELMLKGKWADAEDLYRQAISRNSKNVPAIVGLGMALGKLFKLDGAEEQFDKALKLDPMNANAHVGKAMVLMNRLQSSSQTVKSNRDSILKQAEAEARQALSVDPGSPEGHYNLAQSLKEQGRLDEAAKEYNEAIKSDPQYSEAFAGLGLVKMAQNNYGEAASAFKNAISINSSNSTAHFGLGKAYLKMNQLDAAIKELNTSLALFPNSAPAHLAMGEAYEAQGNNNNAAIAEYSKSISIKPENPEAYLHIADIRESRGDLEHSIAELRGGLEQMPNNPDLHLRIADESLRLEKLDDAIKEYKTVLDADPSNSPAARGLTRGYYLKAQKEATGAFVLSNEYEQAQKYIDQAVRMNPNDMELRLAQAKLNAMSGTTIDLNSLGTPKTDGERVAYSEALLAQNRFKEASDQMNTVISNAQNSKQTFAVADLALMIHDLDSAESAYKKGSSFSGPEDAARGKRGLDMVAKARDDARQKLTLADGLARNKATLPSAIDNYHAAIFANPRVADARLGLANSLEKLTPQTAADFREASVQYKAYLGLSPTMPPKEVEKIQKKIAQADEKAYKLDQKAKQTARGR